jgi:hypothetical protein
MIESGAALTDFYTFTMSIDGGGEVKIESPASYDE